VTAEPVRLAAAKAAQSELAAKSAAVRAVKTMYLDLALQWRQLAHHVETLDRERHCWPSKVH
jgi:hypothetical protein